VSHGLDHRGQGGNGDEFVRDRPKLQKKPAFSALDDTRSRQT
jgi:hypothetical protein